MYLYGHKASGQRQTAKFSSLPCRLECSSSRLLSQCGWLLTGGLFIHVSIKVNRHIKHATFFFVPAYIK